MTAPDSLSLSALSCDVAVIGGGPAGLMAAEVLAQGGAQVRLFDAMPSVGRKFLLAGKGGLNLTHSEPHAPFVSRYAGREKPMDHVSVLHGVRKHGDRLRDALIASIRAANELSALEHRRAA